MKLIITHNLIEAPKILSLPAQNLIPMGSPFSIYCATFAGDKPLFFQFTKNGQILSNSIHTNYKIDNSEDHSLFLIRSVDRSDAGNYSCIVRNAFGEDVKYSQLSVKGLNFHFTLYSIILYYY